MVIDTMPVRVNLEVHDVERVTKGLDTTDGVFDGPVVPALAAVEAKDEVAAYQAPRGTPRGACSLLFVS